MLALDGLRAFALLIIMGYHFGVGWLQGGFFSLDIFYVLSGYLITGLLLGEWARAARIKLGAFWLRRARRLLPALLVVLVVVTLVVRFAYPAGLYPNLRMADLSALFYFSNWWQIADSGNYFVATGAVSPAHPHLVAGRRGAVLPGVAPGGGGRAPPGPAVRPGHRAAAGRVPGRRGGLGHRDGPALPPRGQHHPALLRHRHPRPVDPGGGGAGLCAHPRPAPPGRRRHGPHGPLDTGQGGPHRGRPGRVRRHAGPHLRPDRHRGLRLPGRLPPVGPVGRRHHPGGGVRGRRAHRPGAVAPAHGVDRAPSPTAPTCGTSRSSSSSTPGAPD